MPRTITRQRMGYGALLFHWFMICCTCGLWYPVYASARRSRSTVTRMPGGRSAWANGIRDYHENPRRRV